MNFIQWVRDGEPPGVAFHIRRDFEMQDVERFGEKFQQYVEAVLVAAARHYAGARGYEFLPVDSLTKDWAGVTTFKSGEGEIALGRWADDPERITAAVTMVVRA